MHTFVVRLGQYETVTVKADYFTTYSDALIFSTDGEGQPESDHVVAAFNGHAWTMVLRAEEESS